MKFGLECASSIGTEPDSALEISKVAEEVGFESVWAASTFPDRLCAFGEQVVGSV